MIDFTLFYRYNVELVSDEKRYDNMAAGYRTTEPKTPESQRRATYNYEKNKIDRFNVRVPKGMLQQIQEYQQQKKDDEPQNEKYKSLNAMMISLLEEETGLKIRYNEE